MTDIAVTLRPQQGIQCEENILYLFDPNIVVSIAETTTRQWLDTESQNYINTYIKPILDAYEQDKEREIDAYVEEKQSTIFFDNTNFTGTTTAEVLNVTNSASFNDVTFTGSIDTSTATFTDVIKMRASVSFKGAVAPSWSGIGIYELNDDDSVSLMASMEKIDGFTPASNNTYNIGVNSRKWKDLYLAGKAYIPTINNGGDITVPISAGTMALISDIATASAQKADVDLDNINPSSSAKNTILTWSIPDYSSSINVPFSTSWATTGQSYTAPFSGEFYLSSLSTANPDTLHLYVNGVEISRCGSAETSARWVSISCRVKAGDVITVSSEVDYTAVFVLAVFLPFLGV